MKRNATRMVASMFGQTIASLANKVNSGTLSLMSYSVVDDHTVTLELEYDHPWRSPENENGECTRCKRVSVTIEAFDFHGNDDGTY